MIKNIRVFWPFIRKGAQQIQLCFLSWLLDLSAHISTTTKTWWPMLTKSFHLRLHVCFLNIILDLNSFPQTLQGRATPSRWLASMWSLMAIPAPSFPHTLQILALEPCGPLGAKFWLFSIIDFTFSSSSCKSPDTKLAITIFHYSFVHLVAVRLILVLDWVVFAQNSGWMFHFYKKVWDKSAEGFGL